MDINKNWNSGSDGYALTETEYNSENDHTAYDFYLRFNTNGFLSAQGIYANNQKNNTIKTLTNPGFIYVHNKEFYLHAHKQIDNIIPIITNDVPKHIKSALNPEFDINLGTDTLDYSIFHLSKPVMFDTPITITLLTATEIGDNILIEESTEFDDIDDNNIYYLENKSAALEELYVDVFQTDTIIQSNNNIFKPTNYIYDHLTNNVYMLGNIGQSIIEYETSATNQVLLSEKLTPMYTNKNSGLLVLANRSYINNTTQMYVSGVTSIHNNDSFILISQEESITCIVNVSTIIYDAQGERLYYETISNNKKYAKILINPNVDIYMGGFKICTSDAVGTAFIPILGYTDSFQHGDINITGTHELSIIHAESIFMAGIINITVYNLAYEFIKDYNIQVTKINNEIDVFQLIKKWAYIPIGDTSVILNDIIYDNNIEIILIHETYVTNPTIEYPTAINLDINDNLVIEFNSLTAGAYLYYYTYRYEIMPKVGGVTYGI